MPNRQLTQRELDDLLNPLLERVRQELKDLSGGKHDLHWALRRKLFKELSYDERGKPMQRRKLKEEKRAEQNNKCANCGCILPAKNVVLDRKEAMQGYTLENTRLLCQNCDYRKQEERGFA